MGNWLADMAANQHQPFYEKDNRQHFWSRGRKKKQYYDPTRQSFDDSMYFHNGYNNNQNRLRNKSSHKSLSSLFHRHRDEDDYPQNHYQQEQKGLGSQHTSRSSPKSFYRRQRHHSLPSSSKNPLKHQQPFMNGAVPSTGSHPHQIMDIGLPVLTAAAAAAGNQIGGMLVGNGGGGLGNHLLPQHHHQQLQQQQMLQQQQPYYNRQSMPMQSQHYNNGMFDQYSQHGPYDGSPSQSQQHSDRHRFSSLFGRHHNNRSRHRYEPDHHNLDTSPYSNSYHSPEQQQALNYYQQQQQQHHAYPYGNARFGGGARGGMNGNYPLQNNNQKRHG